MNEKQWEMLYSKVEKMDSRMDEMFVILAKQQVSLDDHIRRTELLENRIDPIEHHVGMVNAGFKIVAGLGTFTAVIAGLKQLFWK